VGWLFFESSSHSIFLFEHVLFGKPLHTFPDHAPAANAALSNRNSPRFTEMTMNLIIGSSLSMLAAGCRRQSVVVRIGQQAAVAAMAWPAGQADAK
jgi:hypothetical protein